MMSMDPELISETDFFFEVARGGVRGHTAVVVSSRLPNLDIVDGVSDIWTPGGDLNTLSSVELIEIVSTDASDVRLIGSGTRSVLVRGLGAGYVEQTEVVEMLGTSPAVTEKKFLRVFKLESLTAGSGEVNSGVLTATSQLSATIQCQCAAGKTISENSQYTVPANHSMQIIQIDPNVTRTVGGGNVCVLISGQSFRDTGNNLGRLREFEFQVDTGLGNYPAVDLPVGSPISEKSDIRFQAMTDKDSTEVRLIWCGVQYLNGLR